MNNVRVLLTASGTAAVMIVLMLCITAIGLYGKGPFSFWAMLMLGFFGGGVLFLFAHPPEEKVASDKRQGTE